MRPRNESIDVAKNYPPWNNAVKTAGPAGRLSVSDEDAGFAMTYGGGLEIRITRRVSFRASFDYGKAYVGSSALPPQRVNSVGYSAGIVFH
jgi:opacity protein-like surface antigen